jgi:hypothetical protein
VAKTGLANRYEFVFSGLLRCDYDNCAVTAEFKKQEYTYYRIFERAKTGEWWAWVNLNHRPRPYQPRVFIHLSRPVWAAGLQKGGGENGGSEAGSSKKIA